MIFAGLGPCIPKVCALADSTRSKRASRIGFALLAILLLATPAHATTPAGGSTSRQSREEALRGIPYKKLTAEAQQKISYVVTKPSIFRRLPTKTIECDPEMYLFLVRYPEVVINIWDLMGVTSVTMQRSGPFTYSADDGLGTISDVELIYGDSQTHVLFANGTYDGKGPLLRNPVKARCVMLLRSQFARTPDDRVTVTCRLDVFVRIESTGIDLLAKTLHPLLGRTADINFVESTKFLGRLSEAAQMNGPGVEELAQKLTKVSPQVRTQFATIANNVHQRALLKTAERSIGLSKAADGNTRNGLHMASRETPSPGRVPPVPRATPVAGM